MNRIGWFRRAVVVAAAAAALAARGEARGQGTAADYARAEAVAARDRGKVVRDRVAPHWYANNDRFWYRLDLADGAREFIAVDAVAATRGPAFDHAKLAESLAKAAGSAVDPTKLPFDAIEIGDGGKVRFEAMGKGWSFDPAAGAVAEGQKPAKTEEDPAAGRRNRGGPPGFRPRQGSPRRADSPDGKRSAFLKDHNVVLRDKASGEETPLSADGTAAAPYEPGFYWSPDSKRLVAIRTTKPPERRVQLIESSPRDQLQPKLSSYDYPKPGDVLPVSRPHLFDADARRPIPVADALFENPWSLEEFRWAADSKRFNFLYNRRGHQALRVIAVDADSGEAKALIDEQMPTFVDYSNKTFLMCLDKAGEILWMSERDGWNHLYRVDAATGAVKGQVTKGEWLIRGIDRVDEDAGQVWFRGLGMVPGEDPYYTHYARINLDGSGLVRLTDGDGNHAARWSPDRRFLLDTYSRVDLPPVTELRDGGTGKLILAVERGDDSKLRSAGWAPPERFVAKGRDGRTDIYGIIIRPSSYDPSRKYPVIEAIYAGPQGAFVPKNFGPLPRHEALAELGFVVVEIDGMGTNWRSKAFHDVCAKNLADAGFPDRILWMKAAAAKDPGLDLDRVGVYGGSAGGQNAMGAVLFHPEFYKAAAADCGCHDNRMDKVWWNEAWMGWPIGPHYAEQSNATNAGKLRGALLLTVGELDHNVDPASTMQVVNALIRANKEFELVVFPGADHGAGSGEYGTRKLRDFFVRNLLGVRPPDRNAAPAPAATADAAPAAAGGPGRASFIDEGEDGYGGGVDRPEGED